MNNSKLLAGLLTAFLAACGSNGPSGLTVLPNGDLVVAQGSAQKGPFLAGSTVTINVLSPSTSPATGTVPVPTLGQTGKTFTLETSNAGTFAMSDLRFSSGENFVQASVDGYYFDEIQGTRSSDQITLRGIFDLTATSLNVNVLTDLSRARILSLARSSCVGSSTAGSGCSTLTTQLLADATAQAEREVLAAFNIPISLLGTPQKRFGNMNFKKIADASLLSQVDPADQVLLAVSALVMQIGEEGSGVTEFINAFETDLSDNGRLDSPELQDRIKRASSTVNFSRVAQNMNSFYRTTRYVAADLQKWVDPSGGVVGVISANSDYYNASTSSFTTQYTSSNQSYSSTRNTCIQLVSTEASSSLVSSAGTITGSSILSVPANTNLQFTVQSTPTSLNGRAKVISWDATQSGCSTTSQPNLTGVYYFAATPPGLNLFANKFIQDFGRCFNLTVTNRVRASDLSNPDIPRVTDINDVCKPLAGSPVVDYKNNGYDAGQQYYWLLSDGSMTKTARITRMDVTDYFVGRNGTSARVLFTYMDRFNRAGTIAAFVTQDPNYASLSTGGWYNTGNQQPVDINLMVGVRQLTSIPLANSSNPTRTLADIKIAYRTAFLPLINNVGPGVVLPDGRRLTAVMVKGPGLPDAGLVYISPLQRGQTEFDFSNLEGTLPDGRPANQLKRCGWQPVQTNGVWPAVPASCPFNWVTETNWASPSVVGTTTKSLSYATPTYTNVTQPTGTIWLPAGLAALDRMTQGTEYSFSLYYGNSTTPTYQYTKRLLTSAPTLTLMASMPWVKLNNVGGFSIVTEINRALASASNATAQVNFQNLLPVAGVTTLDVDWTGQVMNIVEISSLNTNLQLPHLPRATPGDSVGRGLSYGTLAPQLNQDGISLEMAWSAIDQTTRLPITSVPTGSFLNRQRTISLGHRTWDGSWKSQDIYIETFNR